MSIFDIIIRILAAIIVGGFIGYQREMHNKAAGFVTHTLVCVGAAVVALIQLHLISDTILMVENNPLIASSVKIDVGRVVGQVVTGIGFLGAGTIIFYKGSVKGLTTATTVWVVACIGIAIGLGYYLIAIIAAVGVMFIITFLKRLENRFISKKFTVELKITYKKSADAFIEHVSEFFSRNNVQVRNIKLLDSQESKYKECIYVLYFEMFSNQDKIIGRLMDIDSIISVNKIPYKG